MGLRTALASAQDKQLVPLVLPLLTAIITKADNQVHI